MSTQIFLTSRYKFYMSRHNLHWAIIILSTAYNNFSCVRKVSCLVLVSCSCCFLYSWRTLSSLTFDPFCLLRVCVCDEEGVVVKVICNSNQWWVWCSERAESPAQHVHQRGTASCWWRDNITSITYVVVFEGWWFSFKNCGFGRTWSQRIIIPVVVFEGR